jgi:hypothetical protein
MESNSNNNSFETIEEGAKIKKLLEFCLELLYFRKSSSIRPTPNQKQEEWCLLGCYAM